MSHPWKHLRTILKHRHRVIANASHMGIFFHALRHDFSKFRPSEFLPSARYYGGTVSPVYAQRLNNDYFSTICQLHTKRNRHHWEFWTDFFKGRIIATNMPYIYATEYVCDVLSAARTYDPKNFRLDTGLKYFEARKDSYYMTTATKEYLTWAFTVYATVGFSGLKKKITKAKYKEITAKYPTAEIFSTLTLDGTIESLPKKNVTADSKPKGAA